MVYKGIVALRNLSKVGIIVIIINKDFVLDMSQSTRRLKNTKLIEK